MNASTAPETVALMPAEGDPSLEQASAPPASEVVPFAHESEREFARILDFYEIEWVYEPKTFHIRWDAQGRPIESFTPDFYLPEFDLFIELTTLRQSLVTKKNRKLRLLRELYPEINIKLLYNRDFRSLMAKYRANAPLREVRSVGEAAVTASTSEGDGASEEKLSPK